MCVRIIITLFFLCDIYIFTCTDYITYSYFESVGVKWEEKMLNFKQYYQCNTLCEWWEKVEGTVVRRISDTKKVELNTTTERRTKWASPMNTQPEL